MAIVLKGNVVTPNKVLKNSAVLIEDNLITKITDIKKSEKYDRNHQVLNFDSDKYICPGLIDIHTHGAMGKDIMDGDIDSIDTISDFHFKHGVTSFLATTLSAPQKEILKSIQAVNDFNRIYKKGAEIIGINIEGPYLNNEKNIFYGAQNPKFIRKIDKRELDEFIKAAGGLIKIITIAPEVSPDSYDIIKYLTNNNIVVSIGHSNASFEETNKAFAAGANLITHLYNTTGTWHHRETGIIGASLIDNNVYCEIICDGLHVHQSAIKMTYMIKPPEKIITITDSIRAAGLKEGTEYDIGKRKGVIKDGIGRFSDGTIAGSTLTLNIALSNIHKWIDISFPQLINTATLNPATLLGLEKNIGSLEEGKVADIVVFDKEFGVDIVIKKGKISYKNTHIKH